MSLYYGIDPYQQGSQMNPYQYSGGGRNSSPDNWLQAPSMGVESPGMASGGQQQGFGQAPQSWEELINMATPQGGGQSWLEQYYGPSFDGGFASQDADKRRAFSDYSMLAKTAGFDLSGGEVFTPYAFRNGNVDPSMQFGGGQYLLEGAPSADGSGMNGSTSYFKDPLTGTNQGSFYWQAPPSNAPGTIGPGYSPGGLYDQSQLQNFNSYQDAFKNRSLAPGQNQRYAGSGGGAYGGPR